MPAYTATWKSTKASPGYLTSKLENEKNTAVKRNKPFTLFKMKAVSYTCTGTSPITTHLGQHISAITPKVQMAQLYRQTCSQYGMSRLIFEDCSKYPTFPNYPTGDPPSRTTVSILQFFT